MNELNKEIKSKVFFDMVNKDLKTKMFFELVDSIENQTDENELELLSNHKITGIRLLVASNENTNLITLRFLSLDEKEEVKIAAKSNKNFIPFVHFVQIETKQVKTQDVKNETVSFFSTIKSLFFRKELRLA